MGSCRNTKELNECQNSFAVTLAVINTNNKDKLYEFNHRASQEEN
jgi:hypothetical protein